MASFPKAYTAVRPVHAIGAQADTPGSPQNLPVVICVCAWDFCTMRAHKQHGCYTAAGACVRNTTGTPTPAHWAKRDTLRCGCLRQDTRRIWATAGVGACGSTGAGMQKWVTAADRGEEHRPREHASTGAEPPWRLPHLVHYMRTRHGTELLCSQQQRQQTQPLQEHTP